MPTPIQDEPESTVGKKPGRVKRSEPEQGRTVPRAGPRRDAADETEPGGATGDRERREPPTGRGLEQ
jgi:hypothetical protein